MCIYKLDGVVEKVDKRDKPKHRYVQIRVKSIDFHDEEATAIYLYDVSHNIDSVKLGN